LFVFCSSLFLPFQFGYSASSPRLFPLPLSSSPDGVFLPPVLEEVFFRLCGGFFIAFQNKSVPPPLSSFITSFQVSGSIFTTWELGREEKSQIGFPSQSLASLLHKKISFLLQGKLRRRNRRWSPPPRPRLYAASPPPPFFRVSPDEVLPSGYLS